MKLTKLTSHLREDPKWEINNVKNYPVDQLTLADDDGQVRQGGVVSSHVEQLADDIFERGQMVPITIDENGVVIEGNHRLKAFQVLARRHPRNVRWGMIKVYQRTFASDAERRAYQIENNAHELSKPNTNEDYAGTVEDDLKQGVVPDLTWASFNDSPDNFDALVKYIHETYRYIGVGKNKAKAIAKIAAKDTPNSKVKNYTKDEVVRNFDSSNKIGWSGKKSGDDSNGVAAYAVGNKSHVFPNLTGNSFGKKTKSSHLNTCAIIWQSNTFGISGTDLDKYRQDVVESINRANKSHLLTKCAKLVDDVYIAPQKLREGKETSFYRVAKNTKGEFDVKKIPTNGWK